MKKKYLRDLYKVGTSPNNKCCSVTNSQLKPILKQYSLNLYIGKYKLAKACLHFGTITHTHVH